MKMLLGILFIFATAGFRAATAGLDCGTIAPQGELLKRSAATARAGEVPWHVGVYSKKLTPYNQVCGGTLVSASAVISVAHCFWGFTEHALEPASQYAVAAGKLQRTWDEPVDVHAQKSDVRVISIPERFQGAKTIFAEDIAVLKLVTAVQFNSFVRPVCLDFGLNQLVSGDIGKLASWTVTSVESSAPAQALQVMELPYAPIDQCFREVPDTLQYITSDKFCTVGKNSSQVLCLGGSGGGLSFPSVERGVSRHYLRGVASVSLTRKENCARVVGFTDVEKHEHFIKEHL